MPKKKQNKWFKIIGSAYIILGVMLLTQTSSAGLVLIIIGYGIFKHKKWGKNLIIIFGAISLLFYIPMIFLSNDLYSSVYLIVFSLLFFIIPIYYLQKHKKLLS